MNKFQDTFPYWWFWNCKNFFVYKRQDSLQILVPRTRWSMPKIVLRIFKKNINDSFGVTAHDVQNYYFLFQCQVWANIKPLSTRTMIFVTGIYRRVGRFKKWTWKIINTLVRDVLQYVWRRLFEINSNSVRKTFPRVVIVCTICVFMRDEQLVLVKSLDCHNRQRSNVSTVSKLI